MARSAPSRQSRATSLSAAIVPDRVGARSMSPGRTIGPAAAPAPSNDGMIARLFAIAKDHEDTCRRLTDGAKGVDKQLQILREEHTALRVENEALLRCLCRAGVLRGADFNAELKGRQRQPDTPTTTAASPETPPSTTGPTGRETCEFSGRGKGDKFSDTAISGNTELSSPDPHALVQKLIDGGISPIEQQKTLRGVQRALKNPEAWSKREPPLSMVVKAGRTDLVHMLLRSRVNPNESCPKGVMPLHVATFEGNAAICRILLQSKADVDGKDRHGQTPIFFAPTCEVCKLLVEHRTNLQILNSRGQSSLHLAGRAGLHEVLDWLSERCGPALVELRDVQGFTANGYARRVELEASHASPDTGEIPAQRQPRTTTSSHASSDNAQIPAQRQSRTTTACEPPKTAKSLPAASELLVSGSASQVATAEQNGQAGRQATRDANCDHTISKASDCEWMFGDASAGLLGFQALAHWNPLRWSGSRTITKAIEELRKVRQHGDRPIILKVPSGVLSKEVKLNTIDAAINHLQATDAGGTREESKQKSRGHFVAPRPRSHFSGSAAYAAAGADVFKHSSGAGNAARASREGNCAAATEEPSTATRRVGSGRGGPVAASSKVAPATRQCNSESIVEAPAVAAAGSITNGTGRMSDGTSRISNKTDVVLEAAAAVASAAVDTIAKLDGPEHTRPNQTSVSAPIGRVVQPQVPENVAGKTPDAAEMADNDGEDGEYAEGEGGEEEYAEEEEEEAPGTDGQVQSGAMWDEEDEVY